jgi:hypothetical protein
LGRKYSADGVSHGKVLLAEKTLMQSMSPYKTSMSTADSRVDLVRSAWDKHLGRSPTLEKVLQVLPQVMEVAEEFRDIEGPERKKIVLAALRLIGATEDWVRACDPLIDSICSVSSKLVPISTENRQAKAVERPDTLEVAI